ncbi:unnamed protein product [Musa textilis]
MLERPCKVRTSTDPKPWMSDGRRGRRPSPPPPPRSSAAAEAGNGGNFDRVLFKNLVEMVPLVESLMDRRANSSFTRRASVVYTPAPSNSKKAAESKDGRASQTISAKKRRDLDTAQRNNQNGSSDDLSIFSRNVEVENSLKDREELSILREQVNDLQRKILEKDEALKSAEIEINQMKAACVSIDELKFQIAEKDSLAKSINSQLNNAKITLADKQAALERLTWEARMSNRKIEELQGEIISMDYDVAALMQIYEKLCINNSAVFSDDSLTSYNLEPLPDANEIDDIEIEKMEEARTCYLAAVAAAKENPTEESLATAAEARLKLQALLI